MIIAKTVRRVIYIHTDDLKNKINRIKIVDKTSLLQK